jgi:LPXTG-motif cell wall-anchored protein
MRRSTIITLLAAICLSLALFATALAHAELVSSDPKAGANLTSAPSKITLVFSEEISDQATDSFFTVANKGGAEVGRGTLDNTDVDHKTLSGTLANTLADGVYAVSWQALTPDDNGKSSGSFTFGVNADPGAQPTAAAHDDEAEATAAPAATARPTTAAAGAAQPTVTTTAPSTLPQTGDSDQSSLWLLLAAATLVVVAGIAMLRGTSRAR